MSDDAGTISRDDCTIVDDRQSFGLLRSVTIVQPVSILSQSVQTMSIKDAANSASTFQSGQNIVPWGQMVRLSCAPTEYNT